MEKAYGRGCKSSFPESRGGEEGRGFRPSGGGVDVLGRRGDEALFLLQLHQEPVGGVGTGGEDERKERLGEEVEGFRVSEEEFLVEDGPASRGENPLRTSKIGNTRRGADSAPVTAKMALAERRVSRSSSASW